MVVDGGGEIVDRRFRDLSRAAARVAHAFLPSLPLPLSFVSASTTVALFASAAAAAAVSGGRAAAVWAGLGALHPEPREREGDVVHQLLARAVEVPFIYRLIAQRSVT